ncbi:MAG TPA: DNA polymerase Y family protein [Nitrolancea sp.]|jgi:DNA polymerase-4/protein ImuB|nr:DNA polymerase Y family protein [Nitrolancea sp.]
MAAPGRGDDLTVACLFIPHFPLRVEILRHPELDGAAVGLTDPTARRRVVTACSAEAAERGVRVGMSLREVLAVDPNVVILNANPVAYRRTFESLLQRLSQLSPGIEAGELGCIYIDLRGLARQAGGLDALASALLQSIPPILRPHLGLSNSKFTALVAAQHGRAGQVHTVPAAYASAFLAPHSVDLLPVPDEMKRQLHQLGIEQLRDLTRLPLGKVQARFGPDGRRAWQLANGDDREPLVPIPFAERVSERLVLPATTTQLDLVLLGLRQLAAHLFRHPAVSGRGIRATRVQLLLEDQQSWERVIAFKGVVSEPLQFITLLTDRLRQVNLSGAVVEIAVEALGLSSEIARQHAFPTLRALQSQRLAQAIRELTQRYGVSPIYRVVEVEPWSRIPERRHALMSYVPSTSPSA